MTTVSIDSRPTVVEITNRPTVVSITTRQTVVTISKVGVQGPPGPGGDGIPVDPDLLLTYTIARDT